MSSGNSRDISQLTLTYLDSPSSTSELTYSIRVSHNDGASQSLYLNRSADDNDANYASRMASAMILQEIKG